MNITLVSDDLPPFILGGSGRIVWETARGLVNRGHAVTIVTAAPSGIFPPKQDGIVIRTIDPKPLRWAHYRSVFSASRAREVYSLIESSRPDIIHAHGLAWQMGYRWIRLATLKGIPCIYTAHGNMNVSYGKVTGTEPQLWLRDLQRARWTYNPFRNSSIRSFLQPCRIVFVSDALRVYQQQHGFDGVTIHNGIDLSVWNTSMSQSAARRQMGLPEGIMLFLLAGRIGTDKGSAIIDRQLPASAHLILAGNADLSVFPRTKQRVYYFANQEVEQMVQLYRAADVVLVPSVYLDPFPTVCLEAMACERPVIATVLGGAKEAVVHDVTGWIVDPRDEKAFGLQLQWCTKNRAKLTEYGARGAEHAFKNFSLQRYLDDVEKIYNETIPAAASGTRPRTHAAS